MMELSKLDATAQAELVHSGAVSSRELVDAALQRIAELDPSLGAVVGLDARRARAQAESPQKGRFAGVPFLAKDLLAQPELRCAFGSRLFASFVPPEASPYARAIDATGLITLGKTKSSEFGLLGSTETLLDGPTRNPWDLARSAGGSSGGAAAAVAAGLVPMAHASDGGGSIRLPAALCGLFGFMPSRGRCRPVLPPSDLPDLTIEHCVSRSVRDSAGLLADTERPDCEHGAVGFVEPASLGPVRVGWSTTSLMGESATVEGVAAVEHAARLCASLGHHVEDAGPPPSVGREVSDAFFTIAGESIKRIVAMVEGTRGAPVVENELEPFTWALLQWSRALPSGALGRALVRVEDVARSMREFLGQWDVMLSPTAGVDVPRLGFLSPSLPRGTLIERTEQLASFTAAHNMVGAPAMSVPLHTSAAGLPVGCHFSAREGADALLLKLAYQLEQVAPWADRWPPLARA